MKKLKLKALDFEGAEILTREQLKKILGGGMMGTDGSTETVTEPPVTVCYDYSCYCKDSGGHSTGSSDFTFCGQEDQINDAVATFISGCTYGGGCS